jgi:hypothetical protein
MVAELATPPAEMVCMPPLRVVKLAIPLERTVSAPPPSTTVPLARPPDEIVSTPPLLTTVKLADPPAVTLS